ncbi:hypothetical protein [Roseivirga thermotolerans]|uniref:hypothetical protein n=1 Tax=Roseivirga thermotolerans TaxID=1758176 RepID=UPI00273E0525|nr:hypothetical protein [Roseivirga thermotolerans]
MVKNSNYLLTAFALVFLTINTSQAQMKNGKFSPVERDLEISRVTLENFLKKWEGAPLLNRIQKTESSYTEGQGATIFIEAPNARIFLDGRMNWSRELDTDLMDTFYDNEIVALQQQRLKSSLAHFLHQFSNYLPGVKANESIIFHFDIHDPVINQEEDPATSPKQPERTYQISFSIAQADVLNIESNKLSIEQIENRIKTSKK